MFYVVFNCILFIQVVPEKIKSVEILLNSKKKSNIDTYKSGLKKRYNFNKHKK